MLERKIPTVYKHLQTTADAIWTVEHKLGVYPIVDAWTESEGSLTKILPSAVNYVDENTCTLVFSSPITGFATVV